jgi:hypothetical protein
MDANVDKLRESGVLTRMPEELHYLIEPVLRCGFRTEGDVFDYLDAATPAQVSELSKIAAHVLARDDYPLVLGFLDEHPFPEHPESAMLYFFFGALDHAGLKFERLPAEKQSEPAPQQDTGTAHWRAVPAADYDDAMALEYYLSQYWRWHMTEFEQQCEDLGARFEQAKAQRFRTAWSQRVLAEWQNADEKVHAALAPGLDAFVRSTRERICAQLRDGSLPVNRCPACSRIARTPRARQCFWCGHNWRS